MKERTWKWTKKPNVYTLIIGILWMAYFIFFWHKSSNEITASRMIFAMCFIVKAFVTYPEPQPDPRPLNTRLLELLHNNSDKELEKILDDAMRGEEIKQAAKKILQERHLQAEREKELKGESHETKSDLS